jgi:hypothetical protein
MSAFKVLVIGAGERVVLDTLPALVSLGERIEIVGVYSRTPRSVEAAGRTFDVRGLAELDSRGLAGVDLVHVVVAKKAVPSVLARLARHERSRVQLQLETPALLFRHLAHRDALDAWRAVWVSEDVTELPWLETLRVFVASGAIGRVRSVLLDRGAYAYHGVALGKAVLGAQHVASARRRALGGERFERTLVMDDGSRATIHEPRVYADGRFVLSGERGAVSDAAGSEHRLEARVERERCTGFAIGALATKLAHEESELLGPWRDAAGDGRITPHTHALKRVGLRRLFARLAAGESGYPLDAALEDMAVDYHLEKLGRYVRNPLTGAHARFVGRLMRLLRVR